MRRAVQQQKTTDIATIVAKYQSRSFGFASRNFYTAFLAALEIDSNPERYFPNLKIDAPSDTATIAVPAFMTVDTLADALNLRESTLRDAEPGAHRHRLVRRQVRAARVRAARAARHGRRGRGAARRDRRRQAVRRATPRPRAPRAPRRHVVADRGRVPREPRGTDARQRHDEPQRDPRRPNDPAAASTARPRRPMRRSCAPRRRAPRRRPTPALAATSAEGVYVVRRGDSIERIATRLGVDAQALIAANDIRNRNLIQVGQQLIIPNDAGRRRGRRSRRRRRRRPRWSRPSRAAAESPAAVAAEPAAAADLTAALAPAVLANGEPAPVGEADEAPTTPADVNALASEQDVLAADPSDYSVSTANADHRAGARDARPLRRLARDSDAAAARLELAVVPRSRRARPNADARLRAASTRRRSSSAAARTTSSCRATSSPPIRSRTSRATSSSPASRCGSSPRAPTTCRSGCCASTTPTSTSTASNPAPSSSSRA